MNDNGPVDLSSWTFTCVENFSGGYQAIGTAECGRLVCAFGLNEQIALSRCRAVVLRLITDDKGAAPTR